MQNARMFNNIKFALALSCLTAALSIPSEVRAAAGGVQDCVVGSTCTIGEFLYDDSSAPIASASATCTITSKYPDHTSYISPTAMSGGGSDGWYYYEFTTPATTGMYSTQVSCTVSGDTLSIDKSFQAVAASSSDPSTVASAVWGYSGKSLDSFGTLPSDIWNYSTRTISTFGTLVTDVWSNVTRTLTGSSLGSGNLATQDDVVSVRNQVNNLSTGTGDLAGIKKTVNENRLLLEKLVNKPVIENVLEEVVPPISEKLNNTRAEANQLYINNQFLTSQTAALAVGWKGMSGKDILDAVISISGVLGESGDSSSANTMFSQANWIKDSWNWSEANAANTQLVVAQNIVSDLKNGLANYQKTPALLLQVKQLVKISLALEKVVGTTADTVTKKTLFAKIASTQALSTDLDNKGVQIDKVLGAYAKSQDYSSISSQVKDLQNQVIALNKIPGGASAITRIYPTNANSVTNGLLSLKGVIDSNKKLLALGSGQTMVNVWLEVGSIIFKSMVTNPSTLVSQKVEIKYYLPKELKQEDVIKTDAGLAVTYDSEKDQLYVSGTFDLASGQTRTFSVETKDIWQVTSTEIQSIRDQADQLSKPLEKTSYYAQGVTLKSDINAEMDQIGVLYTNLTTPEDKIQAYRQATILINAANSNINAMKELVTQAGAAGNLFGFVGGAQTIAVWGLIIVIGAGFVFMTIYMKTVTEKAKAKNVNKGSTESKKKTEKLEIHSGGNPFRFAAVIVAASVISAGASGFVVSKLVTKNFEEKVQVLGTQSQEPVEATPAPLLNDAVPVQDSQDLTGTGGQYLVIISDTPTGFLKVRKTPGGVEIARVAPGDKLPCLDEKDGWYEVTLESGQTGWVSAKYSSKD